MAEDKLKMAADVCSYVNEDDQHHSFGNLCPGGQEAGYQPEDPGRQLQSVAPRDDFDYVSAAAFCCPVSSKKAKASYKDGMLKVTIPLRDPMEGAHVVKIH